MLHLGAVIPNLSFAADAHYHHLVDDVIEGGPMRYDRGAIRVPARARPGSEVGPREDARSIANCIASWAAMRMIGIPDGPDGRRLFRTIAGPIRARAVPRRFQTERRELLMRDILSIRDRVAVVIGRNIRNRPARWPSVWRNMARTLFLPAGASARSM